MNGTHKLTTDMPNLETLEEAFATYQQETGLKAGLILQDLLDKKILFWGAPQSLYLFPVRGIFV
jgi:hypothetical protein